jgi:hypothetical protein
MIRVVICVLVLQAAVARADTPAEVAKRLVDFAHQACDFMGAQEPRRPHASEPRLAAHFGRVLKSIDGHDDGRRYFLAVPQLPGWHVEYHLRKLRLDPPPEVRVPVEELVNLLGEVDYARVEDPGAVRNDFEFALPRGWAKCYLEVFTDLQGKDVHRQHVTGFYFGQPGPT